ncbi:hypothetical protein K0M31_018449 [Melipona bicolor]|uniref:Uncharacterized protein n=1 Tax=Melipona bicolor TaxID=60889 RepID=A0AA40KRQ1_9HYME|nr:hypothetical protein K0M31_018449 [Melipona bicolor]
MYPVKCASYGNNRCSRIKLSNRTADYFTLKKKKEFHSGRSESRALPASAPYLEFHFDRLIFHAMRSMPVFATGCSSRNPAIHSWHNIVLQLCETSSLQTLSTTALLAAHSLLSVQETECPRSLVVFPSSVFRLGKIRETTEK